MRTLRPYLVFLMLLALKVFARLFYSFDMRWIGELPPDPWRHIRLVVFLNHTSLFEPLFAGGTPNHFLWRVARHGVTPIADKTAERLLVGRFFRMLALHVVSITRQRDETWDRVLDRIDPDAIVAILPEGRMKRPGGLDSHGQAMTVRGGIAEIIESIGGGRMIIAYSGGLHHVHAPGERFPRLFKTLRMRLELLDIAAYREALLAKAGERGLKRAVVEDLERRRDAICPTLAEPA